MQRSLFPLLAAALSATLAAGVAQAQMMMAGDLHIEAPMLRETPPNAPVAAGFVTVVNHGDTDDTLVAASIAGEVAAEVQIHEMMMDEGVMRMREVDGGLPIPAGEAVLLAPGGLHLMVMGLSGALVAGEAHDVTLTFAEAGDVTLSFPVLTLADIRAASEASAQMDHSSHDMSDGGDHGAMHDKHHGN